MIEKLSVEIRAPAEKVLNFFGGEYEEHFKELSTDHIERIITVKRADFDNPDVSFYFKQYSPTTGRVQKIRGKVTKAELDKRTGVYRFETKFSLPVSLVMPGYDSIIEPEGQNTVLNVCLHFTFLAKFAKKSIQRVIIHITEELENAKDLLER
ncbi:MAG: hypothetical protein WCI87_00975 [Euryarchaeota archaeon]